MDLLLAQLREHESVLAPSHIRHVRYKIIIIMTHTSEAASRENLDPRNNNKRYTVYSRHHTGIILRIAQVQVTSAQ